MKVEIWSDFSCPFCYIGKHKLQEALNQFPNQDQVQLEFKSFELDPSASKSPDKSMNEILAEKYHMSVEKAKEMNDNVARQAEEVGLTFNFSTLKYTNTFTAHRLAKYAFANGKGLEMNERLFKAYFTDSENISNHETLIKLAEEVGLDKRAVKALLESNDFITMVKSDQKEAKQIGVTGVPFFVFNQKYAVSGAQPIEVFKEVLEKTWEEEQKAIENLKSMNRTNSGTSYCAGGFCENTNDERLKE